MKNLVLTDRTFRILFLSETYGGVVHDKRMADGNPYPLPAGSWLLQDLGFLAFSLEGVETLTPFKKPRSGTLTVAQKAFNQQLASLRVRIEHVISSVKRCRIVKDRIRLWKQGIRDLVMELCCALHNFRVRLDARGSQWFNRDKLNGYHCPHRGLHNPVATLGKRIERPLLRRRSHCTRTDPPHCAQRFRRTGTPTNEIGG